MALVLLLLSCLSPSAAEPSLDAPSEASAVVELAASPAASLLSASDAFSLREAAATAGLGWPPPRLRLTLAKSTRTLTAWSGDTALKRYRVGLGDPDGDKERQGDRRTPEGELTIVTRNTKSQFHKFLGLSYPNAEDARRGVKAGLISEATAKSILAADAQGRVPPWSSALGGAVGIHGGGGDVDWTLGCVAVTNDEIDELFEVVRIGTRLSVTP